MIPATAAVMNLLAAAASFGVLTAFFQWGWGTDAFGLGQAGPIEAFLPVVTLAILFGLSMDYQVFLVSRMNEEWVRTHRNAAAVRTGQTETGRVITAAATIMICVFLTFSFMGSRDIAEFGIGLAAAVALDAFILRTVLVPAVMHLFGDAKLYGELTARFDKEVAQGTAPEFVAAKLAEREERLRRSRADAIAPLCVFLASEQASQVNGQVFHQRAGELSLYGHMRPVRMVHRHGGWTPETLAEVAIPALAPQFTPLGDGRAVHPGLPME